MLGIDEPVTQAATRSRLALWDLGFRPFYLLASLFSASAIVLWIMHFNGIGPARDYLQAPLWHAHEMVFGYTVAVIVGFLFTAVRNWTGQPTPTGKALAAIVGLWLGARIALGLSLPLLALVLDLAFTGAAAWGIARPLRASGNCRNLFFVAILLAIGAANLAFSLAIQGLVGWSAHAFLAVALDLVLFVIVVMGGRVIPMFTANALPQAKPSRPAWLERIALGSVLALLVLDLGGVSSWPLAVVAAIAAVAHAARLALWQPGQTVRRPILWILHASYAWIVLHLVLRVPAAFDPGYASLATHALTVGGIGGLTLGMMTRTARGHTGRPLTVGKAELAAYLLVQAAAVARVLVPLALPSLYLATVTWAGAAWTAAFAIFVVAYLPILGLPRADGKSG